MVVHDDRLAALDVGVDDLVLVLRLCHRSSYGSRPVTRTTPFAVGEMRSARSFALISLWSLWNRRDLSTSNSNGARCTNTTLSVSSTYALFVTLEEHRVSAVERSRVA